MTTVQRDYTIFKENASKKLKMEYEKIFMEAVDEGLSMLGDSAKQSIYFRIEKMYGIKRNDIPSKTEEFAEALQHIFGLGSKVILIEIMKKLHEKQRLNSQRQINVSS